MKTHSLQGLKVLPTLIFLSSLAICTLLIASCVRKDPLAALPELPPEVAANLRPVPDSALLATKIQYKAKRPAPKPTPTSDAIRYFTRCDYEWKVSIAITTCRDAAVAAPLEENILFAAGSKPQVFKLTDTHVPKYDGLKGPPFVCKTYTRCYPAHLIIEYDCQGTVGPNYYLYLIGVPNDVGFQWDGELGDHPTGPDGFESFCGPRVGKCCNEYVCGHDNGVDYPCK